MSLDRTKQNLERFVRWIMRDVTFHRQYIATVTAQTSSGLLDLEVDDPNISATGFQGVPLRNGLPAIQLEVETGSTVLLAFENGDPAKPYAALWEQTAGTLRLGTIVIVQATTAPALIGSVKFFSASAAGEAAVKLLAANPGTFTVPLDLTIVKEQ